jgi:alkanesulfonate monooxygenase SsuD/methylene tetrahydromethanopterin reductase-like flavin-dependent oxidoreductase (luciferase family)
VRGPSIVPRPPQGQPLIAVLAHQPVPWEFAATSGDVVFITPADESDVTTWVGNVRDAEARTGRTGPPLKQLADLVVFLAPTTQEAADRKARLDELAGRALLSDAAIFVGTPGDLAAELVAWRAHDLDGFRLRPGVTTLDLPAIVDGLVPELQQRGVFRRAYEPGTLRERFGLGRPANRYARSAS